MSETSFTIAQTIFQNHPQTRIQVTTFHENELTEAILRSFLDRTSGTIGVAPAYGSKCALNTLAFGSPSNVLVVRLSASKGRKLKSKALPRGRALLKSFLFCDPALSKCAFRMDKLATALHFDLDLRIANGVDLLSIAKADRNSFEAILQALGGETTLNKPNVSKLFKDDEAAKKPVHDIALQSWAACKAVTLPHILTKLAAISKIDTLSFNQKHLDIIAKTIRDADRLVALKPTRVKNEIESKFSHKNGNLELLSSRFKTRIMRTSQSQIIEIESISKGKLSKQIGKTTRTHGRASTITTKSVFRGDSIRSVMTIGREAPTSAEEMRASVMLMTLQRRLSMMTQPFVQRIWLPSEIPSWADIPSSSVPVSLHFPSPRALNVSQTKAVKTMLSNSDADRVALIHGPPGTGKTTVIAACVTSVMSSADKTRTLWLVAQSNVAVKNIAEKLAVVGFFDFKLLVSKDFHHDWHEHLYEKIKRNLVRSDDFVDDVVAMERLLLGSRVILCTISMLSNHKVATIMRLVPPQTVIFDEASQIEIGDYFPMIYRFQRSLRKLVFIGDDKQLAPYGQSDIEQLQSIFEMSHLRSRAVFLDTQYRMPVPIGNFISANVYDNHLKTVHAITSVSSCRFIDVRKGKEEQKSHSWTNFREVQIVTSLASKLQAKGQTYRIVTPYDAQRSMLENSLKSANLDWKDKCFNIDSFQGNEADYIIISLVRTDKIGFLKEPRRVNVMLTRSKKGMVICTNKVFIEGKASSSLVGVLAASLGPRSWVDSTQVLHSNFRPFS